MDKSGIESQPSYCTIYIVRHGETEWNIQGLLQGHSDSPLTKKGEEQAKKLGEKIAHIHFDAVFSSDSLRSKRTAEIIALEKRLAVKTTKLLRERRFGRYEGKSYQEYNKEFKELFKKYAALGREEQFRFKPAEDIESDEELVMRVITFLREISVGFPGKRVLIVSHGGVMRALLIHLGFGRPLELPPGCVKNLAYIKLLSDGVDFFIKETEGIEKQKWDDSSRNK